MTQIDHNHYSQQRYTKTLRAEIRRNSLYCIKALDDERVILLDRNYKPIEQGIKAITGVDYWDYPQVIYDVPLAKFEHLQKANGVLGHVWLYNELCSPYSYKRHIPAYLEQLESVKRILRGSMVQNQQQHGIKYVTQLV